ncbi:hypothetical protein XA68_15301 [Ophiocordyceps unilateralis]|uniref:Uncharacterized protein n=1 Tax=Ophiocordyceps unilateralis TaxID=268505 RepID=A0A2A9P7G2_OPHUN|nr:hypothetical protein XA68_15301 [Ophiocordyceps unilateralis]
MNPSVSGSSRDTANVAATVTPSTADDVQGRRIKREPRLCAGRHRQPLCSVARLRPRAADCRAPLVLPRPSLRPADFRSVNEPKGRRQYEDCDFNVDLLGGWDQVPLHRACSGNAP